MIVILDYDLGNVCSIQNMLKKISVESVITRDANVIKAADKLILPGVGSYDAGMNMLHNYGLTDLIKRHALELGKPLLGICLGMQLLGRKSEEGTENGLCLVPFDVLKFVFHSSQALKVPHMGWDYTESTQASPLTDGLPADQRYYFVHSYYANCDSADNVLMECDYSFKFAAAIKKDNIYGVQFHPEKSHRFGMQLLKNFATKV